MGKARLPYQLPERAKAVLLALARALVTEPPELVIRDRDGFYIERCRMLLAEFPRFNRFFFILILYVFDRVTFLFGFGIARFVHLKPESQRLYAERWLHARNVSLREVFKGVRGIAMICYFSHPDVWAYIGYDPKAHVAERISLREEILKRGDLPPYREEATTDVPLPPASRDA